MGLKSYVRERLLGTQGWFYMPMWMRSFDREVFRSVADAHAPALDATLPKLSRAADHGELWIAIAAGFAVFGGRRGKRAAMRGVLSLAAASAVANLPAKFAIRRRRPEAGLVPELRRLLKHPTSFSFPSGHSASAAALAVGASLEVPAAAPVLGVLAAGVGASRVYTGVHYPSDVLAGMAIGAGVALLTQRSWPVTRFDETQSRRSRERTHASLDETGRGLALVVNPDAGPASQDPSEQLRKALPSIRIHEASGDDVSSAAEEAVRGADAVGVVGGDGTINAAVQVAHEQKRPLLVVPGGTLNHFARDLGIASAEDAIAAWKGGDSIAVDVATIDGKPFVNTASFGAYAAFVEAREKLTPRLGKMLATPVALARVLRRAEAHEIEIDGKPRRVWMVFIGNCRYSPSGFAPAARARLDDGTFDVRLITAERRLARVRALFAALTGTLARSEVYEELSFESFELRSLDGPLHLARDGETWDGPTKVSVEKLPEPVTVFVPPANGEGRR
jgi:diacylglycerol kinase family enzyme/membrane-associated phospholipid phosphatase